LLLMSTDPSKEFPHSFELTSDHEPDGDERPNLISRQLDLIDKTVNFTDLLRSSEMAVRLASTYHFPRTTVNPEIFPETISDYLMLDELADVTVDIIREADEWVGFGLAIEAGDRTIMISRDPHVLLPTETSEEDIIIRNKSKELSMPAVSPQDITRIVLGLLTGSPVGQDVALPSSVVNPENLEALLAALDDASPHMTEDYEYSFGGQRSVTFRTERYGLGQSQENLEEVAITYETSNPDRKIRGLFDLSSGINLSFRAVENGEGLPFTPHANDVTRMTEVIDEIESMVRKLTTDKLEPTAPSELDGLTESGISTRRAELRRYGASPPDSD
jgi:hypothetical protein